MTKVEALPRGKILYPDRIANMLGVLSFRLTESGQNNKTTRRPFNRTNRLLVPPSTVGYLLRGT